MKRTTYKKLSPTYRKLIDAAERAMKTAYAPYSKHWVGAAVLTLDGRIITGSNVENACWDSVHAEQSAIVRANVMGAKVFKAFAVINKLETQEKDSRPPGAPCGNCRQTIYESAQLGGKDIPIILSNTNKDKIILTSISEILPLAFGPIDVGVDIKRYRS